jgi:hypothetical protein
MRVLTIALIGAATLTLSAAQCVGLADNAVISVNLQAINATFTVNPSANPQFGPPSACATFSPASYLDADFDAFGGARVYDIQVQAIGGYAGALQNGLVTVNGAQAVHFAGAWSDYVTPQSVLESPQITPVQAGLDVFVAAVQNRQPVTVCAQGQLSQAITAPLQLRVEILGQIDARL